MAYSFVCDSNIYLSFDSDCLLIKELEIDINKPFLNQLPADIPLNHPYFQTIRELLNIDVDYKVQYMCEFMIFNKFIMQDLCKTLNPCNSYRFYDPILKLIKYDDKKYSFSEFETYGNFAKQYKLYTYKYYPVYRCGGRFYDSIPNLDDPLVKDFATTYYILQFNHWDSIVPFARILNNNFIRKIIGFKNLMRIYYYAGFYKRDFQ